MSFYPTQEILVQSIGFAGTCLGIANIISACPQCMGERLFLLARVTGLAGSCYPGLNRAEQTVHHVWMKLISRNETMLVMDESASAHNQMIP